MITQVLRENDLLRWSLKVLIVMIWLFGVINMPHAISEIRKAGNDKELIRNEKVSAEAFRYTAVMANKARKLGKRYTPECYFRDLVHIKKRYKGYSLTFFEHNTDELQMAMMNYSDRPGFGEEVDKAKQKWGMTLDQLEGIKRKPFNKAEQKKMLSWLIRAYLLTLLLVIPIYLIRMIERDGILETILAGKLEFIASVLLWPFAFTKYPHELAREVNVEAYLRRSKDLFRRLTTRERQEIQQIANDQALYEQFLTEQKRVQHQRGHALALLATLVICALAPFWTKPSEAKPGKTLAGYQVIFAGCARDGPQWTDGQSLEQDWQDNRTDTWSDIQEIFCLILIYARLSLEAPLRRLLEVGGIEHVPLFGWLIERLSLTINLAGDKVLRQQGGNYVKEHYKNAYYRDHAGCDYRSLCC